MTIAIEPMITAGGPDVIVMDDGWTISTADGSLSAHFEHTVAITGDGPRILTPRVGVPAGASDGSGKDSAATMAPRRSCSCACACPFKPPFRLPARTAEVRAA